MKLRFNRVSKLFGDQSALDDVTASFEGAKSVVLIGPSGGGKSTLLRIAGGLETPTAGSVELNDRPVPIERNALRDYRRGIGFVFQAFNLFPHLSALRNITLPLEKVHRFPPAEAREIAMAALQRFRLEAHAHKRPAELSGGQKQRIAIARATAIKPKVMMFDEPTSALDPEMTSSVLDIIQELKSEGRDFILVTHEMGFARMAADQVVFIADGKVIEVGAPEEIFAEPRAQQCRDFLQRILKYEVPAQVCSALKKQKR